jgi:hypothetical protein
LHSATFDVGISKKQDASDRTSPKTHFLTLDPYNTLLKHVFIVCARFHQMSQVWMTGAGFTRLHYKNRGFAKLARPATVEEALSESDGCSALSQGI